MTINLTELVSCDSAAKSDYELLWRLERLNAERTQGTLVYNPDRNTHDFVIHVEGAPTDAQGYIEPGGGGVVGSSELIWLYEKDGKFFVAAANAMTRLLELAQKGLKAEALKE